MRSSETFCLFVTFLLVTLCYAAGGSTHFTYCFDIFHVQDSGSSQDCGLVTVQQGGKANLTFSFNQDISALRYNFEIHRYDFNNKYRDKILDCFWTEEKMPECHYIKRFSIDVNVSQLHIKIDKTSKNDEGIYECIVVVSDDNKMVVCRWALNVQDANISTQSPCEDITSNTSQSISVTLNSSSEDKSRNVGWEQSSEHAIPVILGVIVFLAILVTSLLYFIKRHSEEFQQCRCFHTENKKETDESLETKTELLCKDTKTETRVLSKVDNDINLQETKPESEEQHSSGENNRTETSASAATHMM